MKKQYSYNWYEEIENRIERMDREIKEIKLLYKEMIKSQLKKLNREGYYYSCDRKKWIKR